jgi:hypothetical protein
MADIAYRLTYTSLWEQGISFPLDGLYTLIEKGVWSDEPSAKAWEQAYPEDHYQLWNQGIEGFSSEVLSVSSFPCPWCGTKNIIPLESWHAMFKPTHDQELNCQCGQVLYGNGGLSIRYLCNDLTRIVESLKEALQITPPVLKGRIDTSDTKEQAEEVLGYVYATGVVLRAEYEVHMTRADLEIVKNAKTIDDDNSIAIENTKRVTDFLQGWAYDPTEHGPRTCKLRRAALVQKIFKDAQFRTAYITPWPDFSLDLAREVVRQSKAWAKLLNTELATSVLERSDQNKDISEVSAEPAHEKLAKAHHEYLEFMKTLKGDKQILVPTPDIDVFWRTHQLSPQSYSNWCLSNLSRLINPDDAIEKGDLATLSISTSTQEEDIL